MCTWHVMRADVYKNNSCFGKKNWVKSGEYNKAYHIMCTCSLKKLTTTITNLFVKITYQKSDCIHSQCRREPAEPGIIKYHVYEDIQLE